MSEEFNTGRSKAKYAMAGIAAVFFLLILPGFVLAIASNMADVELRITPDKRPAPEYELLDHRIHIGGASVWLRVPEDTSGDEMKRIIRHVLANRVPVQKRVTFYVFSRPDPKTELRKRPSMNDADQTYVWTLRTGIDLVE